MIIMEIAGKNSDDAPLSGGFWFNYSTPICLIRIKHCGLVELCIKAGTLMFCAHFLNFEQL